MNARAWVMRDADRMSSTLATRHLAPIGRSAGGLPRTFRLESIDRQPGSRDVAYRRLAWAILAVDVATTPLHAVRRQLRAAK